MEIFGLSIGVVADEFYFTSPDLVFFAVEGILASDVPQGDLPCQDLLQVGNIIECSPSFVNSHPTLLGMNLWPLRAPSKCSTILWTMQLSSSWGQVTEVWVSKHPVPSALGVC